MCAQKSLAGYLVMVVTLNKKEKEVLSEETQLAIA
jgi:hypothetical protein